MPSRTESSDAISIRGLAAIQRTLKEIDAETAAEMRARLKTIGDQVALVAASKAPRRTGALQHSIKTSVGARAASIYSTTLYGGAVNYGAFPHAGPTHRGPHIPRARAAHYMDKAVTELSPWVETQAQDLLNWLLTKFEE